MPNGLSATVKKESTSWAPPPASARMCGKCGHIGQLWRWWKIAFCRACLCFSVPNYQHSQ